MNNLTKRIISAIVYGVLFIGCSIYSGYTLMIFLTFILTLALTETYHLSNFTSSIVLKLIHHFFGVLFFFFVSLGFLSRTYEILAFSIVPIILSPIVCLFLSKNDFVNQLSRFLFSFLYPSLGISALFALGFAFNPSQYNPALILSVLVLIWANDTFAYFTGMIFGKHKLAETISPKKTWEGLFGGLIFTVIISLVIHHFYHSLIEPVSLGIVIVISGTLGDLIESKWKREAGVKDSGTIMPGHGGIFDRIDSIVLVAPVVFVYLYFFKILNL
ncbi:MAG: phosphatidate cytidylyltransferase [Vicingaceae bacterium]|nr:MAG: phosphatidate cytidylyltransferase [Vicingaceae bacterium]